MDTTKTSREEAARRQKQGAPEKGKKRPAEAAAPRQSRPEGSRSAEARPQRPREDAQRRPAQGKRPQAVKEAPAKKQPQQKAPATPQAQRTAAPVRKKQSPSRKRPASQEDLDSITGKKRAYGNSKPKKKSAAVVMGEAVRQAAKESAAKRKAKNEKKRPKQPTPAIIYTQPQAFNRNRLVMQLITVTAVVLALVIGLSVFFKVEVITVTGVDVYTDWTVREASGIKEGDGLLTFSRARAGAQIIANLPYVKNVSFGIKLPDTVNIIIEEEDVVYAIQDQNAQWWLMNSDGRVVMQIKEAAATNYTQVLGVALHNPANGQRAEAAERMTILDETTPTEQTQAEGTEETIPLVGTTGAMRLSTVLEILKALEDNDIVGSAASVDVSQIESITLWYGTRYQVNLGDASRLDYKVDCMNDVILNLSDYESGVLDVSFKIWPDKVGYTPFA